MYFFLFKDNLHDKINSGFLKTRRCMNGKCFYFCALNTSGYNFNFVWSNFNQRRSLYLLLDLLTLFKSFFIFDINTK